MAYTPKLSDLPKEDVYIPKLSDLPPDTPRKLAPITKSRAELQSDVDAYNQRLAKDNPGFRQSLLHGAINSGVIEPINALSHYIGRPIVNAFGANEPDVSIPELPAKGAGGLLGNLSGFLLPLKEASLGVEAAGKGLKYIPKGIKALEKVAPSIETYTKGIPALGRVAKAAGEEFFPEQAEKLSGLAKIVSKGAKIGAKEAAIGAGAGFLGSPIGENKTGAAWGAGLGAASPLVGKALSLATKPVVTKAITELEKPLIKRVQKSVKSDDVNSQGDSFLDQGAKLIKKNHDDSAQAYRGLYSHAQWLGDHADKAIKQAKTDSNWNKVIFEKGRFIPKIDKIGESVRKHMTQSQFDMEIKPYLDEAKQHGDANFKDSVNFRQNLSEMQPAQFGAAPLTGKMYGKKKYVLNSLRKMIDQDMEKQAENLPGIRKAKQTRDAYLLANKSFSDHVKRFYEKPKAIAGDDENKMQSWIDALQNPDITGNFISKNFVPSATDVSNSLHDKLSGMLNDKEKAKDLIKTAMFSRSVDSGKGFYNKYFSLFPKQRARFFTEAEQKMMNAAKKAIDARQSKAKGILEGLGHYGGAGTLGYLVGHVVGTPALGALTGMTLKGLFDVAGRNTAKRASSAKSLDKVERLINDKSLSYEDKKLAKKILQSAIIQGGTSITPHKTNNALLMANHIAGERGRNG